MGGLRVGGLRVSGALGGAVPVSGARANGAPGRALGRALTPSVPCRGAA